MRITCSCCGNSDIVSPRNSVSDLLDKGWRSYSVNLYCPTCSATWHERNDKPLGSRDDTYTLMWEIREKRENV